MCSMSSLDILLHSQNKVHVPIISLFHKYENWFLYPQYDNWCLLCDMTLLVNPKNPIVFYMYETQLLRQHMDIPTIISDMSYVYDVEKQHDNFKCCYCEECVWR